MVHLSLQTSLDSQVEGASQSSLQQTSLDSQAERMVHLSLQTSLNSQVEGASQSSLQQTSLDTQVEGASQSSLQQTSLDSQTEIKVHPSPQTSLISQTEEDSRPSQQIPQNSETETMVHPRLQQTSPDSQTMIRRTQQQTSLGGQTERASQPGLQQTSLGGQTGVTTQPSLQQTSLGGQTERASQPGLQQTSLDGQSGVSSQPSQLTVPHLKIATKDDLWRFLRAIQLEFLRVVDPRESGLLDVLMSAQLVTDTDHESLSGKHVHTRKEQARKLWFLLHDIPVPEFVQKVGPELCRQFPHIIPDSFLGQEQDDTPPPPPPPADDVSTACLRHGLVRGRVRIGSVADILYHRDCISLEEYRNLSADNPDPHRAWMKALDSCGHHDPSKTAQLTRDIAALLERYQVHVPDNLENLVSRGIPCTCHHGDLVPLPSFSPMLSSRKIGAWMERSQPFLGSMRSTSNGTDSSNYSGRSSLTPVFPRAHGSESHSSRSSHLRGLRPRLPERHPCGFTAAVGNSGVSVDRDRAVQRKVSSISIDIPELRDGVDEKSGSVVDPVPLQVVRVEVPQSGCGGETKPDSALPDHHHRTVGGSASRCPIFINEVKQFIHRHCLLIISILVVILVTNLGLTGAGTFHWLFGGMCASNEQRMETILVNISKQVTNLTLMMAKQQKD